MLKGYGVTIFNNFEKRDMKDYLIDYNFYISETNKLMNELKSNQLNLFRI